MAFTNLRAILLIGPIMDVKKTIASFFLILVASSAVADNSLIGVVKVNGKGEWNLYSARSLKKGDKISLQYPGKNNKAECCVSVVLNAPARKQSEVIVTDENKDQEVFSYKLKSPLPSNAVRPFIGIAAVDSSYEVHGVEEMVLVEEKGKHVVITSCLGSEGVHILARTDKNLVEHLYLNLGYSVKESCTDNMLE